LKKLYNIQETKGLVNKNFLSIGKLINKKKVIKGSNSYNLEIKLNSRAFKLLRE